MTRSYTEEETQPWAGLCARFIHVEYPSKQECEEARDGFSKEAIGDGYAYCEPITDAMMAEREKRRSK